MSESHIKFMCGKTVEESTTIAVECVSWEKKTIGYNKYLYILYVITFL